MIPIVLLWMWTTLDVSYSKRTEVSVLQNPAILKPEARGLAT